jgi:copper chaperone
MSELRTTLSVPDISCDHCKTSIEGAVSALAGVNLVEVHIDERTVDVAIEEADVSLDTVVGAIEEQGYLVDR